jgi:hypothetical protein
MVAMRRADRLALAALFGADARVGAGVSMNVSTASRKRSASS